MIIECVDAVKGLVIDNESKIVAMFEPQTLWNPGEHFGRAVE